jgi:hypothetical protein
VTGLTRCSRLSFPMMVTASGELSNTCSVRYSARLRSVMSRLVSSTSFRPSASRTSTCRLSTTTRRPSRVHCVSSPVHVPSRSINVSNLSAGIGCSVQRRSWLVRPMASAGAYP